jgi:hypothetical protein
VSTGSPIDYGFAADAAAALGEIADADGLRVFERTNREKPHPKQDAFVNDDEHREVMFIGANRSGKSKGLAARIAKRVRRDGIKRLWIVAPSMAMARQNVLAPLFGDIGEPAMIPASEVAHIEERPELRYIGRDGWEITVKSCEQGASKFAGAAVEEIDFDEPPTWPVYNECAIRFGAGKRCLLRLAATLLPPAGQAGGICAWLWSEKIEPYVSGRAPSDLKIINVAMRDNPHITAEQLDIASRLYPPGSLDRRIRIDGEMLPGLTGARCYARFDRRLHLNMHIGRTSVDSMKPLYLGCDFNVDPLGWIIAQRVTPRLWRVLDEVAIHSATTSPIEQGCDALRQRYTGHRAGIVICGDATGARRTSQTGKTDYDLMIAALKDHFTVQLRIPDRNPAERDCVNIVNFFLGGGDADVQLEISGKDCPELVADLEQVLWKEDGSGIRKARDKNDPYYKRTAWSDGLRYLLWANEATRLRQAASGRLGMTSRRVPAPAYGFTA